jgi:hypothetical protein
MHKAFIHSVALLASLAVPLLSATAQAPARWQLQRDLSIGTGAKAADTDFTRIKGLAPLADGGVLVVEYRDRRIRRFGANGAATASIGREGSGPGEFRSIYSLGQVGDSIWVTDVSQRRTSLFSSSGRHLATEPWTGSGGDGRYQPIGYLADGTSWGESIQPGQSLAGPERPKAILRRRPGSRSADTLAVVETKHTIFAVSDGPTIQFGKQPFQDAPLVVASPTRSLLYVIERAAAQRRQEARFRVSAIRSTRDTAWSRTYAYTPIPISKRTTDSVFNRVMTEFRRSGATREDLGRTLFLPQFEVPVAAAFVSDDGSLWLQRESTGDSNVYWVLSPIGELSATVLVPKRVTLLAARGDAVWGTTLDADDVPSVERWRVRK